MKMQVCNCLAVLLRNVFTFLQGLELCLLDYEFHILSNAFLVHFGVKSKGNIAGKEQLHKIRMQDKMVAYKYIPDLHRKYGYGFGCRGGPRPLDDPM